MGSDIDLAAEFDPAVRMDRLQLARACCELSRRDGAIVAWHEVPGTAPPKRAVPLSPNRARARRRARYRTLTVAVQKRVAARGRERRQATDALC